MSRKYFLIASLLCVSVVFLTLYQSQSQPRQVATVYQHHDLNGERVKVYGDIYYLGSLNDKVSSIRVHRGYEVRLYYNSHFGGQCCLVVVGPYTLYNLGNVGQICQCQDWEDTISSIEVFNADKNASPEYYQIGSTVDCKRKRDPDPGNKW